MDGNNAVLIAAIVVAAASELIALSPMKSNSMVQLALQILKRAFPKR